MSDNLETREQLAPQPFHKVHRLMLIASSGFHLAPYIAPIAGQSPISVIGCSVIICLQVTPEQSDGGQLVI